MIVCFFVVCCVRFASVFFTQFSDSFNDVREHFLTSQRHRNQSDAETEVSNDRGHHALALEITAMKVRSTLGTENIISRKTHLILLLMMNGIRAMKQSLSSRANQRRKTSHSTDVIRLTKALLKVVLFCARILKRAQLKHAKKKKPNATKNGAKIMPR